jgi:hypothetical protein
MSAGLSAGSKIGRDKLHAMEADEGKLNKINFLQSLAKEFPNISLAAHNAGIKRTLAYSWKTNDKEFAEKWQEIEDDKLDLIENCIFKTVQERGGAGYGFPFLKAYRRDKWGDKQELSGQITSINFISAVRNVKQIEDADAVIVDPKRIESPDGGEIAPTDNDAND